MKHDYTGRIDATTIQTETFGIVQTHLFGGTAVVERVVIEQEGAADAEWNVQVDGSAIFASTQSVASGDTLEAFEPDQNAATAASLAALELDVTASSGTTGSLIVGALVDE